MKKKNRGKRRKSPFLRCMLQDSHWFLLELIMAFTLAQLVVKGNDLIATAVDQMLAGNGVDLPGFMKQMLLITAAGFVCAALKSVAVSLFSIRVQTRVKDQVGRKLYHLEYRYFDQNGSSSVINKMNTDIAEADAFLSESVPNISMELIAGIVYAVYVGMLNWKLLALLLISYPLVLLLTGRLTKKTMALTRLHRQKADRIMGIAQDSVSGILVLRAFCAEKLFQKQLDQAADEMVSYESQRVHISNNAMLIRKMLQWTPNILCAVYAYILVLHGELSIGSLMAFIIILGKFVENFVGMPFDMIEAGEYLICIRRIEDILLQKEETGGDCVPSVKGEMAVEFSHVDFSYVEESPVLSNLSFALPKGSTTAFVGDSGGGKSTIFHILCGFYPPTAGSYRLFGMEFRQWDLTAAREQFALVSQNVFLFPTTIRENIAYGNQKATQEEIVEACKNARIHDFIMGLPEQYETMVGERGILLSGGERQRLSIARAILKDAPILLLDEPTSAVDVGTEAMIQEAIDHISRNRTCIIIAHRLSTVRHADRIMVLKDGRVAESGTHEELLAAGGIYAGMYGKEEQS